MLSSLSFTTSQARAGFRDFVENSAPQAEQAAPADWTAWRQPDLKAQRAEGRARTHGGQTGLATWYGPGFHGRKTASGERFNTNAMTAAHRSLPFGTRVQVVSEATGRSVVVRINDRGPFRRGAVIDLSHAASRALGMDGTARVRLVSLGAG
ncbi:MAG: septal ring lytic transglycosylase RlpA family protein [Methylobacteriaceae bacterium]|nr:septal ring lytic transglycosylase RlpA family protein [Methylobacteriaceae bacterium]